MWPLIYPYLNGLLILSYHFSFTQNPNLANYNLNAACSLTVGKINLYII